MSQSYLPNKLRPLLDIAGSPVQSAQRVLSDESSSLGALTGVSATATMASASGDTVVLNTSSTGFTAGNFVWVSGAGNTQNNGIFFITDVSGSAVSIRNAGVLEGSVLTLEERLPYSLQDDLDFTRTDRQAIKGVPYDAPVPTYQRPTDLGTDVAASLANIAGKTTDARGFIVTRAFRGQSVTATSTQVVLSSAGNLKHSDATDKTGIPCFDLGLYANDPVACYVEVQNSEDGTSFVVQLGPRKGEKIYGLTYAGAASSPDAVEVRFFSVPLGGDLVSQSTPYVWEATQPATIDLFYGFYSRLDQLDDSAFRTVRTLGVTESGDLRQDINDLQSVLGSEDKATSLEGLLTNTGPNFAFSGLRVAPTVVEALNILNAQIGDQSYAGSYLSSGQSVAGSLQALSNSLQSLTQAFTLAGLIRVIERVTAPIEAHTPHTLPGGLAYVQDAQNNGNNLWVFWRGLLKNPGAILDGNDYEETNATTITPYATINAGDHIVYFVLSGMVAGPISGITEEQFQALQAQVNSLTTDDVAEGSQLYFTDARAKGAAVVDSLAGSQTDQAPSVRAVKEGLAAEQTRAEGAEADLQAQIDALHAGEGGLTSSLMAGTLATFAPATFRSFIGQVSVFVSGAPNKAETFSLIAANNGTDWMLSVTSAGDNTGVDFAINSAGALTYADALGQNKTVKYKFSALTV